MTSPVRPFSIVLDTESKTVAWLPATLKFYELDSSHAYVAREAVGHGFDLQKTIEASEARLGPQGSLIAHRMSSAGFFDDGDSATLGAELIEPTGFRVSVTEKCNLRCQGCFSTTYLARSDQKLRNMSFETADRICKNIILPWLLRKDLFIHFFGGEPFLKLPLLEYISERLVEQNNGAHQCTFAATSNGTIISAKHIAFLRRFNVQVGISVELDQVTHDQIRASPNGRGSFSAARSTFHKLRDAGVDVHILTTPYPPLPADAISRWQALLAEFPATRVTINTPFDDETLGWLGSIEHLSFLVAAHRLASERGIEVDSALTPILAAMASGLRRLTPQAAEGSDVLVGIDPNGHVVRSTQKFTSELISTDENLLGIYTFGPECADCVARFVCGGPNEEYQLATGLSLDLEKCEFHRQALRVIAMNQDLFAQK